MSQHYSTEQNLKRLLKFAIIKSGKKEPQICEELSALIGRKVGVHTLSAWVAESKEAHRVPASAIPALCEVLGSDDFARALMGPEVRAILDLHEEHLDLVGKRLVAHIMKILQSKAARKGARKAPRRKRV
jgi:hypothetical protein